MHFHLAKRGRQTAVRKHVSVGRRENIYFKLIFCGNFFNLINFVLSPFKT